MMWWVASFIDAIQELSFLYINLSRGTETPEQVTIRLDNAVKELAAGEVQPFWEIKLVNADKVEAYVSFVFFSYWDSSNFLMYCSCFLRLSVTCFPRSFPRRLWRFIAFHNLGILLFVIFVFSCLLNISVPQIRSISQANSSVVPVLGACGSRGSCQVVAEWFFLIFTKINVHVCKILYWIDFMFVYLWDENIIYSCVFIHLF